MDASLSRVLELLRFDGMLRVPRADERDFRQQFVVFGNKLSHDMTDMMRKSCHLSFGKNLSVIGKPLLNPIIKDVANQDKRIVKVVLHSFVSSGLLGFSIGQHI